MDGKEDKKSKEVMGKVKRAKGEAEYERFLELKRLKGNFDGFENKLFSGNRVGIILGARGAGKSALGMKLLENFKVKTKKEIYALGFKAGSLPRWIKVVENIKEIKNNSVVLIDEGGIELKAVGKGYAKK